MINEISNLLVLQGSTVNNLGREIKMNLIFPWRGPLGIGCQFHNVLSTLIFNDSSDPPPSFNLNEKKQVLLEILLTFLSWTYNVFSILNRVEPPPFYP